MTKTLKWMHFLAMSLSLAGGLLIAVPVGLLFGPQVEKTLREAFGGPVLSNWTVTEWHVDGNDVVLTGHMAKNWACDFQPPNTVTDERGTPYVVDSSSATRLLNWPADGVARRFGPWRVVGAAGHLLTFSSEHNCHPLWPNFTRLGTLDTSEKKP